MEIVRHGGEWHLVVEIGGKRVQESYATAEEALGRLTEIRNGSSTERDAVSAREPMTTKDNLENPF
jgi:hypothetical protein